MAITLSKTAQSRYNYRRAIGKFHMLMAYVAMGVAMAFLGWILFTLIKNGIANFGTALFLQNTPPPMMTGGLKNAIVGSVMMVALALIIGTPLGVLCGIYLAEFGKDSRLARATRFINDILLFAPSIVIGLFIYGIYVVRHGGFSGYAGALALALLVIPITVRTSENMLNLVPNTLREAAYALGSPRYMLVLKVSLPAAKAGVMTGIILALARIAGETAPLLFTAMNSNFFSTNMQAPMANLPNTIYQFAMSPHQNWQGLAWAGALIVTLFVLVATLLARYFNKE